MFIVSLPTQDIDLFLHPAINKNDEVKEKPV